MAVDMFLKIDGIEGESADGKHKKEIDVYWFRFGFQQSASGHVGGGSGAGKVSVSDLSIKKKVDKSSPDLYLSCCSGKHLASAKLTVRKAGPPPVEYMTVTLEEVIISSINPQGTGATNVADDLPMEDLTLNFRRIKVEYIEQTGGGLAASTPKMGWDVGKNDKI